jgi:hypothetical protein
MVANMKIKSKFAYVLPLMVCLHLSYALPSRSASDPHPAIKIPIFHGGYNLEEHFDASDKTKFVTYRVQTNNPPTEVLEFYDAYFNGKGWRSAFETCQRNWENPSGGRKTAEPFLRQLYASWAHAEKKLKAVLWLTYEVENNASQSEIVVQVQIHPKTAK